MFDLGVQQQLPRYELKLVDGTTKSYDSLLIGYKLQELEGETEPAKIRTFINELLSIEVDAIAAIQILDDFATFSSEFLEEPLKKVLGRQSS